MKNKKREKERERGGSGGGKNEKRVCLSERQREREGSCDEGDSVGKQMMKIKCKRCTYDLVCVYMSVGRCLRVHAYESVYVCICMLETRDEERLFKINDDFQEI